MAFKLVGLIAVVGFILVIVGQTSNTSSFATMTNVDTRTKIGMVLLLVSCVGLCMLFLLLSSRYRHIEGGERRLVLAVGLSLPLLFVRIIYSILVVFANNPKFNQLTGNVTIYLVMSVLEEMGVVLICLVIGFTLPAQRPAVGTEVDTSYSPVHNQRADPAKYQDPNLYAEQAPGRRRRSRRGPIGLLIGSLIDLARTR
jgi:hypothetical protein